MIAMGKAELSGNPDATMAEARMVLREARREAKGQGLGLRARQAAEKVWLAASTAADAMAGGKIGKAAQVFDVFEKAWGAEGRTLAEEIEGVMHRTCFYSNAAICRGPFIDKYAGRLDRLLHKPVRDRQIRRRLVKNGKARP
jgi:hypothetical protein